MSNSSSSPRATGLDFASKGPWVGPVVAASQPHSKPAAAICICALVPSGPARTGCPDQRSKASRAVAAWQTRPVALRSRVGAFVSVRGSMVAGVGMKALAVEHDR